MRTGKFTEALLLTHAQAFFHNFFALISPLQCQVMPPPDIFFVKRRKKSKDL